MRAAAHGLRSKSVRGESFEKAASVTDRREGWMLPVPAYEGGTLSLERVMFNFANEEAIDCSMTHAAQMAVRKYFPDVPVMKCHTGQSVRLGGLIADVITTHEDYVGARKGTTLIPDLSSTGSSTLNSSSVISDNALLIYCPHSF